MSRDILIITKLMEKLQYPALKPGTVMYKKYMALLKMVLSGAAKTDNIIERHDLRGALAEIRRRLPNLVEPIDLNEEQTDKLLTEVQNELRDYYVKH